MGRGRSASTGLAYHPIKGIALKIVSVLVFVTMASLIKAAGDVPPGQIVFMRSFFAIFPVLAFLWFSGELAGAVRTSRPFNHLARGMVGVTSMGLGFFALTRLPLPEAIALNYAQPLFIVAFSALFAGEVVRVFRWTAVVVGLVGVIIISWPKLTLLDSGSAFGDREAIGVLAALLGAAVSGVAAQLTRSLIHTEKTATIVLWFSLTGSAVALCTLPFGWSVLSGWQLACLVGAGLFGGVGQILMTQAYRHADLSTVAPFEYTSMLIAIVVGYLAFGDVPTIHMLVGSAIVIAAGIFIIWREQRLGLERAAATTTSPPQ